MLILRDVSVEHVYSVSNRNGVRSGALQTSLWCTYT